MPEQERVDITGCSFKGFIDFIFQRDIPAESSDVQLWYWNTEVEFDPAEVCQLYVQLFEKPEFLCDLFSSSQLEQGFWAITSSNLECSARNLIWHEGLEFRMREYCVKSMYEIFERLFAVQPLDTCVGMWWDSLCYDWHCGNRSREKGGEDARMQDVMFETLSRILELSSPHCQEAALHGRGHLHHPLTSEVIGKFLDKNPNLSDEQREYAVAAMRFEVL
jgi:hypothetical protein